MSRWLRWVLFWSPWVFLVGRFGRWVVDVMTMTVLVTCDSCRRSYRVTPGDVTVTTMCDFGSEEVFDVLSFSCGRCGRLSTRDDVAAHTVDTLVSYGAKRSHVVWSEEESL